MSGTIVRRRVVGFVKAKSKGKSAGPRKQAANSTSGNDRMVGEASRAMPMLARPAQPAAADHRGMVWLAAAAVIALAAGGALLVVSAAAPSKERSAASATRASAAAAGGAGAQRRSSDYGSYPDAAGAAGMPSGDHLASTAEGFLAAGYVRRKPQLPEGEGGRVGSGGTAAKAAATPPRSLECVVGGEGAGRDIGACLNQLVSPSSRR